jgi:hypothetical protein
VAARPASTPFKGRLQAYDTAGAVADESRLALLSADHPEIPTGPAGGQAQGVVADQRDEDVRSD